MSIFLPVTDDLLTQRIMDATRRVVFIAPAVSKAVADGLKDCFHGSENVSVTVVLDPNEDAYRIGYGDLEGLERLKTLAEKNDHLVLRSQPGLRIGLLLVDDDVLVWSPTPRAVEGKRDTEQPNGLDLSRGVTAVGGSTPMGKDTSDSLKGEGSTASARLLADILGNAVGADDSDVLPDQIEIGRDTLTTEQMGETVKELKENPPVPFDLALKTRVLSTKFQFVEFEVRGVELTKREIKLSTLLLNADLTKDLQDLLETRIKPFSQQGDLAIEVPTLVQGQIAYNSEGREILSPMTQADIEKAWKDLRGRYLKHLPGFGWLIRRAQQERFKADVADYQSVLKAWVKDFGVKIKNDKEAMVKNIVKLIEERYERSPSKEKDKLPKPDINTIVLAGIEKLRDTVPTVKLVFKEISWESTRDDEFTEALRKVLPVEEQEGWFEVFTAARQQST